LRTGELLDVERATPLLDDAAKVWITSRLVFFEQGVALATPQVVRTRLSLPTDRSFSSYALALAHVTHDPSLTNTEDLPWRQAMLDVELTVPIGSDQSHFSFEPTLAQLGLRTTTVLHFLPPG